MNDKLLVSGDIDSGWATINFELNHEIFSIRTSYIFDGLANLLTAISLLNKGIKETEASLIDEPTEHIIHFTKSYDEVNIIIKCFTFQNFNGKPLSDRINNTVRPDFTIETTLKQLTTQICSFFHYFRHSYSLDGYEDRWRHPFPSDKLRSLLLFL